MSKNKATKATVEEDVMVLKKHFGGVLATVKALMEKVDIMEKKLEQKENDQIKEFIPNKEEEIKEIVEAQKVIEETLVTNSNAIERIDMEIKELSQLGGVTAAPANQNDSSEVVEPFKGLSGRRNGNKCRYYNRGHCKYRDRCKFYNPQHICKRHLESGRCDDNDCGQRHPKVCKYWQKSNQGCKRDSGCNFLHQNHAENEVKGNNDNKEELFKI